MTEMDDVLKDRLNRLKADRDRAKAALERAKSHSSQAIQIDPALLSSSVAPCAGTPGRSVQTPPGVVGQTPPPVKQDGVGLI
jgi:hypothetical protein